MEKIIKMNGTAKIFKRLFPLPHGLAGRGLDRLDRRGTIVLRQRGTFALFCYARIKGGDVNGGMPRWA